VAEPSGIGGGLAATVQVAAPAPATVTPGMVSESGLVFKSAAVLDAEARAKEEEKRQKDNPVLTGLAAYINNCYSKAKEFKELKITPRLLKNRRQVVGEYEAEVKAAITAQGGCDQFFNLTRTKSLGAQGWIRDIVAPANDQPFDLFPTPIPDLPDDTKQKVASRVASDLQGLVSQAMAAAAAGDPNAIEAVKQQVYQAAMDAADAEQKALFDDAKKRAERMSKKIQDQFIEGGFYDAMGEVVTDVSESLIGILKGPVIKTVKRLKWGKNEAGEPAPEVQEEQVPTYASVAADDFFPGPNCRHVNESYLCERSSIDQRDLSERRGVEGWSATAIDAVLTMGAGTSATADANQAERDRLENRDSTMNSGMPDSMFEAVEFWGSVPGKMIREWGKVEGVNAADPATDTKYFEVTAVLIRGFVVRLIINPHPLGHRPYKVTSYIKIRGSIWGESLPEQMTNEQAAINLCCRAMLNNLNLGSRPQSATDISCVNPVDVASGLYPGKNWQYDGTKARGRVPVQFFNIQDNTAQGMQQVGYWEAKADDRTMVPRFAYGNNEQQGGAASTATGMSMLMNNASKGIRRCIGNFDQDIIRPIVTDQFVWNMIYLDNKTWGNAKGDVQVIPRGVLAILVKEQEVMRRQEVLQLLNNDTDNAIIGANGRRVLLESTLKLMGLPEGVVPSDQEFRQRSAQALAGQQPPAPTIPPGTMINGFPAGEPPAPAAAGPGGAA
jgi:hypothetical protein